MATHHDHNGYGIIVGCYVNVEPDGMESFHGWVEAIEESERHGTLACVTHDIRAYQRLVPLGCCTVAKPTNINKARRIGHGKTIANVSDQARRVRRRV